LHDLTALNDFFKALLNQRQRLVAAFGLGFAIRQPDNACQKAAIFRC
jgi:hypothetical protein